MIHELRTYTLKPGSVPEFEARFKEALTIRMKYSKLAAFWHTEIGPLNQVLHLWPYDDLNHRTETRAAAVKEPSWPPDVGEYIVNMESEILIPAPFMRPLEPRQMGNIYEMRRYTYQPGVMPEVLKRWGEAVPHREKFSPLAACWYTELGGLNRLIHLWPYKDLNERASVRAASFKDPNWPPATRQWILTQENKILVPADFSPLK